MLLKTRKGILWIFFSFLPLLALSMDIEKNSNKRTYDQAELEENEEEAERRPAKQARLSKKDYSETPILTIIDNAYKGDENCRNILIEKLYYAHISAQYFNIDFERLLRMGKKEFTYINFSYKETFLICKHNPNNILSTYEGTQFLKDLEAKAETSADAKNTLSRNYLMGIPDVWEIDQEKAIELSKESSSQGCSMAQYNLASYYMSGIPGVLGVNKAKAIKLYKKAAAQGLAAAQCILAFYSMKGIPNVLEINRAKAIKSYKKAADQGVDVAQCNLAYYYMRGIPDVLEINKAKAIKLYIEAVNQGHATAQNNLAYNYMNGIPGILETNKRKAIELYTEAADQEYATAQNVLAYYYMTGISDILEVDEGKAIELYTEAADQGYSFAQCNLAFYYMIGIPDILNSNKAKAIELYTKAADQGVAIAQNNLANSYMDGILGVLEINKVKAIELFIQAADQENVTAQFNLAGFYMKGIPGILDTNTAKAIELFTKAANQGDGDAQHCLRNFFSGILLASVSKEQEDKIKSEISEFSDVISYMSGALLSPVQENKEKSTLNVIPIPSLYRHYSECFDFLINCINILNHILSDAHIAHGFLVDCIELNHSRYRKDIIKQCSLPSTVYLHLQKDPLNHTYLFTFEDPMKKNNFQHSLYVQKIMKPKSSENQNLKNSVDFLTNLHIQNIGKMQLKALKHQRKIRAIKKLLIKDDLEVKEKKKITKKLSSHIKSVENLNFSINEDQNIIDVLKSIETVKIKFLQLIRQSTSLRNQNCQYENSVYSILIK